MAQHGADDAPVERLDGWRLSDDPAVEARMYAALRAIGGWRARCALAPDDIAATRASWRSAYRSAASRLLPHEDAGRLPRIGSDDNRPGLRLLPRGA
jgi:hypothetical protein